MSKLILYHTGFEKITEPDIHFGRKNADFAQGFYLTANREFSVRWARERKGLDTVINTYELETEGLNLRNFKRDKQWFNYIFKNRSNFADIYPDYDVIIGPIANDTIYDIWGITTSGFLSEEQALSLLEIGPLYEQIVIKTQKAASQLKWVKSEVLENAEIAKYSCVLREEEKKYQDLVSEKLGKIADILE